MIVLDAGVLIAHLNGADAFHRAAQEFLEAHAQEQLAASAVTIAEALVHPARAGAADRAEYALERLLVRRIDVLGTDASLIAEIRARTALKLPDSLVIHLAQKHAASIATTDHAVGRAAAALQVPVHVLS